MSDDIRFEATTTASPLLALIPLLAAAALAVCARGWVKGGRLAWLLPQPVLLLLASAWYGVGLGESALVELVVFSALTLVSGLLVIHADRLPLNVGVRLALTTLFATLALELTWNEKAYTIGPQFWVVELALVGCAVTALWLAGRRRGALVAPLVVTLTLIGILQHYVLRFRGTSILPSDVFAFGTALSVSSGYTYTLGGSMLLGLAASSLALAFASTLAPGRTPARPPRDLVVSALCVAVICALVLVPDYGPVFGAYIDYWWSKDWYERQGFLPSFVFACQDLKIQQPQGYSEEKAREVERRLAAAHEGDDATRARRAASTAQFEATRPNIFVIQNETYCDLSVFGDLGGGYLGPAFWNTGLTDALSRGDLAVSVFGGGTCNTEFEFLCGCSLAFVGTAKYPFTMYDLTVADSLPRQLREVGYRSIGIHPNIASNWNRDRAYAELGFDQFLTMDDFADAELYHTHVSDWATFERMLDLIEESTEPLFVFDVTMQNHSGYDTGSIPENELRGLTVEGLSAEDTFQLNEFVACIDESDRAFERLLERLRTLSEPTVVVMYGDHHPWFSQALNDLVFPDEDALAHAERIHNTCYAVWANYDVAGTAQEGDTDHLSADLLGARMLDLIGAPLTDFQRALLASRTSVRALNADGWRDPAGVWHELDDTLADLELVEYLNFGSKV